jgi:serine protease
MQKRGLARRLRGSFMSNFVYREQRPWRDCLLLPLVLCFSAQACSDNSTQSSESMARQSAAIQAVTPTLASPKHEPEDRPTELVIKFRSSGPHAVTECAETWLKTRRSFRDATADRSDSLDINFRNWKVSEGSALVPGRTGLSTAAAIQLVQTRLAAARSRFPRHTARAVSGTHATSADFANVYRMKLGDNLDAERAAKELSKDPHIEYAQPNYKIHGALIPNDPFFSSNNSWGQGYDDLWAVKKIGAPTAWDTTQGDAVIVAVVDSGADPTHPDLAPNLWVNPHEIPGNGIDDDNNGFVDDVRGWNFASGNNDPTDGNGHGTHVSGTIAAVGNNGQGIIGIAPKAHILPVKALDDAGNGTSAGLASALIYAAQNGADVINNSWACTTACPSNPVIESAVAQAHGLGATLVFAAGNSSADITNFSPQNQPDVIVVSASDQNDQRTSFSNFGLVDVAAPGGSPNVPPPTNEPDFNILSLRSATCAPNICQPDLLVGTNLLRLAGTSMAAPHVSGLAALIVKQNPSYSPEEVRQVIRKSAVDIGSTGFDTDSGYGRISASNAITQPRPLAALITAPFTALDGLSQVDITGTAMGTGFASWRLDYGSGTTPTTFTTIATSTVAVNQARLTTWNLSTVPDGTQTLRLVATSTSGQTYEDRQQLSLDNVKITSPASGTIGFARTGDVVTVIGTVAPANFISYSFSIAKSDNTPLTGANLTLPNGGNQKVVNGVLATWNTAGLPRMSTLSD